MDQATQQHAITEALAAVAAGAEGAMDRLVPLVYDDLSRIARRQLSLEATGHTLSTGALVHEAYLRIANHARDHTADRAHFFGAAAQAMRRVLVDHARRHRAARRGGVEKRPVSLEALEATDSAALAAGDRADVLLALDEALERLAVLDPRQARVVECRFFGGLTAEETADALGVTTRTVERDWVKARGWLYQALRDDVG
jgi:RNA polymerase sigma factor (TIGR02999 family)